MNPIWGNLIGVFLVILIVTFIGGWIWVWRKAHLPTFSRLAQLPLEDAATTDIEHTKDEQS